MSRGKRILDHDPVTGMTTYGCHEGDNMVVSYEQDVEAELEACKELAKNDDHFKAGVKKDWLHYAHLPDAIIMQLFAKGINVYAHDADLPRIFREVNREYPYFKLTTKHHERNSVWE